MLLPQVERYLRQSGMPPSRFGREAVNDPRWAAYPLKIVLAGEGGQYLAGAQVRVSEGDKLLVEVRCDGPWLLFKLEPAHYQVTASVNGASVKSSAYVVAGKQGRIVLRFPALGGALSPEHIPPME